MEVQNISYSQTPRISGVSEKLIDLISISFNYLLEFQLITVDFSNKEFQVGFSTIQKRFINPGTWQIDFSDNEMDVI